MWNNDDSTMQNEGGYMDTSANTTMPGENKASNFKRGQNCVPVMIAHLNRYGEDLSIWGMPARLITFVATLCKVDIVSTKVNFIFRDDTGTIKGIKWLDSDTTSWECPVSINSYARVYGMMRNQNDENFVLIVNVQPVEHLNELLTHLMEVTAMSLEGEKMMSQVAKSDQMFINNSMNATTSAMGGMDNPSGLNKEQAIVLNIIQHSDPEYGAERSEIKSKVPSQVASKVDEILEFLSGEGHIYTTKTDDYFKVI